MREREGGRESRRERGGGRERGGRERVGEREREREYGIRIRNMEIVFNKAIAPFEGA